MVSSWRGTRFPDCRRKLPLRSVRASPAFAGEADRSEPEIGELVDRVLVDLKEVVGDDVLALRIGMDDAEPFDRVAVLDLLAVGLHLANADEHAARFGRIPHEPAQDRAFLDELASLPRRKRPDHEHFAYVAFLLDGPAGADRALAAEREEAFQVRMRRDQVEGGR